MRALLLVLLLCLTLNLSLVGAPSGLRSVQQAQALLGPETWTKVLRIQNDNRASIYARTVYALIFEFAGILWFYTDADGTQSFSLYQNRLEHEKSDLAPGLREIDPGFKRFQEMDAEWVVAPHGELPNGCFIESLVAGRGILASQRDIKGAHLLLVYAAGVRAGHCIFAFETADACYALDPTEDLRPRRLSKLVFENPQQLSFALGSTGQEAKIRAVRRLEFPVLRRTERPPLLAAAENAESGGTG
jgi:hypothetical protein